MKLFCSLHWGGVGGRGTQSDTCGLFISDLVDVKGAVCCMGDFTSHAGSPVTLVRSG